MSTIINTSAYYAYQFKRQLGNSSNEELKYYEQFFNKFLTKNQNKKEIGDKLDLLANKLGFDLRDMFSQISSKIKNPIWENWKKEIQNKEHFNLGKYQFDGTVLQYDDNGHYLIYVDQTTEPFYIIDMNTKTFKQLHWSVTPDLGECLKDYSQSPAVYYAMKHTGQLS